MPRHVSIWAYSFECGITLRCVPLMFVPVIFLLFSVAIEEVI